METEFLNMIPVLPSEDINRDILWYKDKTGFEKFFSDDRYAILNIRPLFEEFVRRGTVTSDMFKNKTSWKTNEFGFYDLNKNAIFIMEDSVD